MVPVPYASRLCPRRAVAANVDGSLRQKGVGHSEQCSNCPDDNVTILHVSPCHYAHVHGSAQ